METLLTEEIIENCVPFKWGNPEDMFYVKKIAEAMRKATLKAVGELLSACETRGGEGELTLDRIIKSLLRGEMPDKG